MTMRIEAERLIRQSERDLENAPDGVPCEVYDRATAESKVTAADRAVRSVALIGSLLTA